MKQSSDFAKGISARSSAQALRGLQLPKSLDVHRLVIFLENFLSTAGEKARFRREVSDFLEEVSVESSASSSSCEEAGGSDLRKRPAAAIVE